MMNIEPTPAQPRSIVQLKKRPKGRLDIHPVSEFRLQENAGNALRRLSQLQEDLKRVNSTWEDHYGQGPEARSMKNLLHSIQNELQEIQNVIL